jgi:hypothetical protein
LAIVHVFNLKRLEGHKNLPLLKKGYFEQQNVEIQRKMVECKSRLGMDFSIFLHLDYY